MDRQLSEQSISDRIRAWIDEIDLPKTHPQSLVPKRHIPTDCDSAASADCQPHHAKRRRLLTPSPTSSPGRSMSFSLHKRAFDQASSSSVSSASLADSYEDADQTPTKLARRSRALKTPSRRSGSVSPKKAIRNTALSTTRIRSYDATQVPESLKAMWRGISEYDGGIGVIGRAERDAVKKAIDEIPEFGEQLIREFVYEEDTDPGRRASLGPTPSVNEVRDIVRTGKRCRDNGLDEQSWNAHVHTRVLSLAFRGIWEEPDGSLLACMMCTTASIMSQWADSSGRRVDFCVCIQPDEASFDAIKLICHQNESVNCSINHTDYEPLATRPIALSIETKKPGVDLANAEHQLITWHTAQWRVLEHLVSLSGTSLPLPDFLPGIIIQGHEWIFVASTYSDGITTLWINQSVGSTTRALGVYQIVCVLQYIRRWIEQTYWPWYQRAVLQLPAVVGGPVAENTKES